MIRLILVLLTSAIHCILFRVVSWDLVYVNDVVYNKCGQSEIGDRYVLRVQVTQMGNK